MRTIALLSVLLLGCGASVVPGDAGVDARRSRVGEECSGSRCGPGEFCNRFSGLTCLAATPGCELRFEYCDPNTECPIVPCAPCVAEVFQCPAGTHCVHDTGRNYAGFYDVTCAPN